MKKILIFLTFVTSTLALAATEIKTGNGDIGSGDSPSLQLSCSLHRRYLATNGKDVVTENITPPSLKAKPVEIFKGNDASESQVPMTSIKFKVSTPDGPITVVGSGAAMDLFKSQYTISTTVGSTLEKQKVSIGLSISNSTNRGERSFKYDQQSEIKVEASQNFGVGTTPQGFVVNQYYASCQVEKK